MQAQDIIYAFILTLLAGLSTGLGSLVALFCKRADTKFLSLALGFSAGVMIYVSFVEILPEGKHMLQEAHGKLLGNWCAAIAFFGGIMLIAIIDKLVPKEENPHEAPSTDMLEAVAECIAVLPEKKESELKRVGIFTALAIAIHNFPEGMATFTAALSDPTLGLAIAVAIAIHNIPEGIAVSVPVYYATGNRKKAFAYSFLSGLAEPLGALIGFLILLPFLTEALMGMLFCGIAGIMVFISLDELLPTAEAYGEHHLCAYGVVSGMVVMALSLLLLQ